MSPHRNPEFRELDENDIHSILARNNVGRLVFDWGGRPDIRPLHYVYSDGRIYGRTAVGAKFARGVRFPAQVVFEVDEIEAVFRWKSVIVRGEFDVLLPDGPDVGERKKAARLLQRVVKHTLEPADPVPERDIVFRITVDEATGRSSN